MYSQVQHGALWPCNTNSQIQYYSNAVAAAAAARFWLVSFHCGSHRIIVLKCGIDGMPHGVKMYIAQMFVFCQCKISGHRQHFCR